MSNMINDNKTVHIAQMQHQMIWAGKAINQDFKSNPHPEAKWFADGGSRIVC